MPTIKIISFNRENIQIIIRINNYMVNVSKHNKMISYEVSIYHILEIYGNMTGYPIINRNGKRSNFCRMDIYINAPLTRYKYIIYRLVF